MFKSLVSLVYIIVLVKVTLHKCTFFTLAFSTDYSINHKHVNISSRKMNLDDKEKNYVIYNIISEKLVL